MKSVLKVKSASGQWPIRQELILVSEALSDFEYF